MASLRRVPSGRAGRIWLIRRIHIATRGVELLDRKLSILRTEQQRFHLIERSAGQRWVARAQRARMWLTRAAVLGGQRDLRLAIPRGHAEVDIGWTVVMGVRYPRSAMVRAPAGDPGGRSPGSSAMGQAAAAHADALQAAADHAVALAACRAIDNEVREVHRRLNAIKNRWLPRLTQALLEVERRLEEVERSETGRLQRLSPPRNSGMRQRR